jgi:hypothetical protein
VGNITFFSIDLLPSVDPILIYFIDFLFSLKHTFQPWTVLWVPVYLIKLISQHLPWCLIMSKGKYSPWLHSLSIKLQMHWPNSLHKDSPLLIAWPRVSFYISRFHPSYSDFQLNVNSSTWISRQLHLKSYCRSLSNSWWMNKWAIYVFLL